MAGRPIFLRSATKFPKIGLERVYEMDASEGIHLFRLKSQPPNELSTFGGWLLLWIKLVRFGTRERVLAFDASGSQAFNQIALGVDVEHHNRNGHQK